MLKIDEELLRVITENLLKGQIQLNDLNVTQEFVCIARIFVVAAVIGKLILQRLPTTTCNSI